MRLDQFLFENGFVSSRTRAQELIKRKSVEGFVKGKWIVLTKPSYTVSEDFQARISDTEFSQWVSRSGEKLHKACKKLEISFDHMEVLDVGQSTGGFSQCALKMGASKVIGFDVGHGQLDARLKESTNIEFHEGLDVREACRFELLTGREFDFVVVDVSFISVTKFFASLLPFFHKTTRGLVLIKPQFEVGRSRISKGGLVKGPDIHLNCQNEVFNFFSSVPVSILDYFPAETKGKDGNQEFFLYFSA